MKQKLQLLFCLTFFMGMQALFAQSPFPPNTADWRLRPLSATDSYGNATLQNNLTSGTDFTDKTTLNPGSTRTLTFQLPALSNGGMFIFNPENNISDLTVSTYQSDNGSSWTTLNGNIYKNGQSNKLQKADIPQSASGKWFKINFQNTGSSSIQLKEMGLYQFLGGRNQYFLLLGASITESSGSVFDWRNTINTRLGTSYQPVFFNWAVGGDNTYGLSTRIDEFLAQHPQAGYVLLEIGGNDVSATRPMSFSDYKGSYLADMDTRIRSIVQKIINAGKIPVLSRISYRNYPAQTSYAGKIQPAVNGGSNQENGSLPYNFILDKVIKDLVPDFWSQSERRGTLDFYQFTINNQNWLVNGDGIHFYGSEAYHIRDFWTDFGLKYIFTGQRSATVQYPEFIANLTNTATQAVLTAEATRNEQDVFKARILVEQLNNQATRVALLDRLDAVLNGTPPPSDTQAPTVPANLTASNITANSFTLAWSPASDNVGVTAYDVFQNGNKVNSVTSTAASLSGLSASTTYTMIVKARDAAGNVSAASPALSVSTAAAPVTGTPEARWILNFGGPYSTPVANYNNLFAASFPIASGTAFNNLIKTDGSASAATLVLTSSLSGGGNAGKCSGTNAYDNNAINDWWRIQNNEVFSAKITGLNTTKTYSLLFLNNAGLNNALSVITINNVSKTANGLNNCSATVSFDNIIPNASGEIAFSLSRNAGYFESGINVLELQQYGTGTPPPSDTQAPTVPANLTASNITANSFTLAWSPASDNVGVTAYDVFQNGNKVNSVTSTSASLSGLSASTTYTMTVKARDAAGNVSAASPALSVSSAAAPVTGTPEARWILNFGGPYSAPVANYNNLFAASFPIASGTAFNNLIKTDGSASAAALVLTSSLSGGGNAGKCSGTNAYDNNAINDWWRIQNNEVFSFKCTGLSSSKNYTLLFLQNSGNNGAVLKVTINGVSSLQNGQNNCGNTLAFTGIVPSASGEIVVSVSRNGGYFEAGINVLEIQQFPATALKTTVSITKTEPQSSPSNENLVFAPNPTDRIATATYFAEKQGELTVQAFNSKGSCVVNKTQPLLPGNNVIELDFSHLPAGLYFVQLHENGYRLVKKILVVR